MNVFNSVESNHKSPSFGFDGATSPTVIAATFKSPVVSVKSDKSVGVFDKSAYEPEKATFARFAVVQVFTLASV